jgi:5'-nucleotidase
MPILGNKLVIGISSRALFNLDESHEIFIKQGLKKYIEHQIQNENVLLKPGVAFQLISKLLHLKHPIDNEKFVEVILVSTNDANTGLRVFNSIEECGLDITRACFTNGRSPIRYLDAFETKLFLSANADDVKRVLNSGHAAARILSGSDIETDESEEIRIAFDGDAVLFSDESEEIYQAHGLAAFQENERKYSDIPMAPGPFKDFLSAVHQIQQAFELSPTTPIRTALVTARNAPAHKRIITTLRSWGVTIDEAFFLGGLDKTPFLQCFKPHIFFDDQEIHCTRAAGVVPTGHVLSGVKNLDPALTDPIPAPTRNQG